MSQKPQHTGLAEKAMQLIGRNVLNFQKIEQILKCLIQDSASGALSELKVRKSKQDKAIKKAPMGIAANKFFGSINRQDLEVKSPEDIEEAWVSFCFSIEMDQSRETALRSSILELVNERNELIHGLLPGFKLNSDDECKKMIVFLDKQNERVRRVHDMLMPILRGRVQTYELMSEVISFAFSDENWAKLTRRKQEL